jgi:hypothetical protein
MLGDGQGEGDQRPGGVNVGVVNGPIQPWRR